MTSMARKADLSAASHSDRKPLLSSEAPHSNATARDRVRPASHRGQSSESRVRHSLAPSDDRRSARMRARSEERRVGKECRSRLAPEEYIKKKRDDEGGASAKKLYIIHQG